MEVRPASLSSETSSPYYDKDGDGVNFRSSEVDPVFGTKG